MLLLRVKFFFNPIKIIKILFVSELNLRIYRVHVALFDNSWSIASDRNLNKRKGSDKSRAENC